MWQLLVEKFSDLIQFCYHLSDLAGVPNYGLAIILMTVLIKIVLYPLTNSQLKSMRAMQELQPKMREIQERYRDNPEKMQAETLRLYREQGVNPLSGCLPLLIQLPILMAFYSALVHFKYAVPSHAVFLWVPNLSKPDPWFLLPILAALTTYFQQKISTMDPKDPTQRSMLIFMPLFIGWMATRFAAGLALYWVMFNLLSIAQQLVVNRKMAVRAETGGVQAGKTKEESRTEKGGKKGAGVGEKRKDR